MDWFPSKDFEGEIKEGKESHIWMCGKLSFFSKGWYLFPYLCSEENGQVVLCLKEYFLLPFLEQVSWECAFVTVKLQWQNCVNLTD